MWTLNLFSERFNELTEKLLGLIDNFTLSLHVLSFAIYSERQNLSKFLCSNDPQLYRVGTSFKTQIVLSSTCPLLKNEARFTSGVPARIAALSPGLDKEEK